MKPKTVAKIIGVVTLAGAAALTQKWTGLSWWKAIILFVMYGWALNMDRTKNEPE